MTARRARTADTQPTTAQPQARLITSASVVTQVVVRAAGLVPARLDLTHAATPEQQLGIVLGNVLVYLRSGITARAVAEGWADAAVHARGLTPAVTGRRPLLIGPSTVSAMVHLVGTPQVTAGLEPARADGAVPAVLRIKVGPITWLVHDATAFASMHRTWRQAARLLGDNPTDDE
ncbi:hypothetical protein [Pseudonocardia sp. 73-21]|uniref:hypothetical protein n=1 Tax=Pseudonocardia sp. 73-21 TaxID=1895809 RepID=UPI000960DF38|nr:hypothetical protein [Pseudonocardia sp. 73-21]OJY39313.1 MAG: hypothetical protein BGP03_23425 [Pseudonocardia sp. 73-21]